jgi:uncharacterized membrane protein (DUF4010 family)
VELFQRLGLALAIGLLVGIERGWRGRDEAEGARAAGVRTYALSGLLGGIAGELGRTLGGWAFATLGLAFAGAFVVFKLREQQEEADYSVTAVVAALLVFALGAYAVVGDWRAAAAAAVVMTALLAFKGVLHDWLKRLTWPELRSALILLAMSFVALPLLPDQRFGPYGAFNPYELWMLTIAIAGISFLAYAVIRLFGPTTGVVLAAVAGAMISSTAVTLFLARRNREAAGSGALALAGAGVLAGGVMAARMGIVAGVLAPAVLVKAAPALGTFLVASAAVGLLAVWRGDHAAAKAAEPPAKSPFDLGVVIKFALLLGVVMAAARILSAVYGQNGVMVLAAVAGLADVDAVTLAVSQMSATKGLDPGLAANAILLAGAVDSVSKAAIATIVGGPKFGGWFAAGTAIAAAFAGVALWMTH